MFILGRQRLDLGRERGNALVEVTPILSQVGNEANDAQRQSVRGRT
jgi:hypothetical protein